MNLIKKPLYLILAIIIATSFLFSSHVAWAAQPTMPSYVTADTNFNGKIDKITITFSENVNIVDGGGAGDGFLGLTVTGYTIANQNYAATNVATMDLILTESANPDTGATPNVTYNTGTGATIKDAAAAEMADGASVAIKNDGARPVIVSTAPAYLSTNISPDRCVEVFFSEAMSINTVTKTCTPDPGGWSNTTWELANTKAVFFHSSSPFNSQIITFKITDGRDPTGNVLASGPVPNPWTFQVSLENGEIIDSGGGTVSPSDGKVQIDFPAGAVENSTTVTIQTETDYPQLPSGYFIAGDEVYDFQAVSGGSAVTTFNEPVSLTFTYEDQDIAGLNESSLKIYYWDEVSSGWVALSDSSVNTATNTVTATTTHFTYFGVLGEATSLVEIKRIWGDDRYKTAIEVSKEMYSTASSAVLTSGENYPDALSSAGLADSVSGPLLLTNSNSLTSDTLDELSRLGVSTVYIVGGVNAVSLNVESTLSSLGYSVTRISGTDRYDTAQKVSDWIYDESTVSGAVIVSGEDFPDALSASCPAALVSYPLLFVKKDSIPQSTKDYLSRLTSPSTVNIVITGGASVISENVAQSLNTYGTVSRISGNDRYATAIQVAEQFSSSDRLVISTGEDFPDALVGGVLAIYYGGPVILVKEDSIPSDANTYIQSRDWEGVHIIGGTNVISSSVEDEVESLLSS